MPMYLYLGDITRMETDAIVNAAGTDLRRCPGICDAIFAAADTEKLERACRKLGSCFHGSGIVLQNAGFVLFDVVDAADSNAVGVDVLGSVVRSQYAQNSVVLGNRISFFVGGSDHGSVLVDRSRSTGVID